MGNKKKEFDRMKNKVVGEVKETTGKVTGNETLELKGKIQSGKADLRKKTNVKEKMKEMKENVAGKINDKIDKSKKKKKKKKK